MSARVWAAAFFDARFLAISAAASVAGLFAFGLVSAIIPNPVFGRPIPPEPFAIVVWLASGILMGLLAGTYLAPPPATAVALSGTAAVRDVEPETTASRTSTLGYVGGIAAFLAIGCPVCNKIILVLLGTSGALSFWAPLQPIVGIASVVLLAGGLAWRLRMRARGNACSVA